MRFESSASCRSKYKLVNASATISCLSCGRRLNALHASTTNKILPHTENPPKGIIGDFIKGGGELIKALTDAGVAIWREFRDASEVRRKEIRQELEALRWSQFSTTGGKPPA
jgi:hypothetical protein